MEETRRCKKLDEEIDRMKFRLEKKEEELTQTKAQMDGVSKEKNHLEKALYITKTACEDLGTERAPLEKTIQHHKDKSTDLLKKLEVSQIETDALQRMIEVHDEKVRAKDSEIRSLRGTIRKLGRKLQSIEGAFVDLAGTDDKILKNHVKKAYQRFVKGEER